MEWKIITLIGEALGSLIRAARPPQKLREFVGHWSSRYQSEDDERLGEWITDATEVTARWPRTLVFRNRISPAGAQYRASGRFVTNREILGTWRETRPGASAGGIFHLYVDSFGDMMFGICSGPTGEHKPVYGGWILARRPELLDQAHGKLVRAMIICPGAPQEPGARP
jgi:hypothetical protein